MQYVRDIPVSEWPGRWPQVRLDQFKRIDDMEVQVLDALNTLCDEAENRHGWTHRINSDYREDDTGQHGKGDAVDVVFYVSTPGDVPVLDQFTFAYGLGPFRRIGFYPYWNAPGIHVDLKNQTLYWWRDDSGKYQYSANPSGILTWRDA